MADAANSSVFKSLEMKCRKCRHALLSYPEARIESSHGNLVTETCENEAGSTSSCSNDVWYIPEDHMPPWMSQNIEKGGWEKGKVLCPKCDARLGSYNFISGMKCPCGLKVLPPVHINKSKVDFLVASLSQSHTESS